MLTRIDDFFAFLGLSKSETKLGIQLSTEYGEKALGMTHTNDYKALGAVVLHHKPKRIFEIGTYKGLTSDFFLNLNSDCEVVSIAYKNPWWKIFSAIFNNSDLPKKLIGSEVQDKHHSRFTQIYGNSHALKAESFIKKYGRFDAVLIDGDHSGKGVALDTIFARTILNEAGVILWHDANPKSKYMDVRKYLENELELDAIATRDDFIGGIAYWSSELESRLKSEAGVT